MFCSKCGKDISEMAKFCPNCGCEVKKESVEPVQAAEVHTEKIINSEKTVENQSQTSESSGENVSQQNEIKETTPIVNPYYNNAQNQNTVPQQKDEANIAFCVLSFIMPIFGIIMFFAERQKTPKSSKKYLMWSLISLGLNVVFWILYIVFVIFVSVLSEL